MRNYIKLEESFLIRNRLFLLLIAVSLLIIGVSIIVISIYIIGLLTVTWLISSISLQFLGTSLIVIYLYNQRLYAQDLLINDRIQLALNSIKTIRNPSKKELALLNASYHILQGSFQLKEIEVPSLLDVQEDSEDFEIKALKEKQLDSYLVSIDKRRFRLINLRSGDIAEFIDLFNCLEMAYNGLYFFMNITEYDVQKLDYMSSENSSRNNYNLFFERYIPQEEKLYLNKVSFASEGIIEIIADLNIFTQIRKYLKERHEKKKDNNYRSRQEKEFKQQEIRKLQLQNDYLEKMLKLKVDNKELEQKLYEKDKNLELKKKEINNQLLKDKQIKERLRMLKEFGLIEEAKMFLLEKISKPLAQLELMEEEGLIDGFEDHDDIDNFT
jgi:hypothetical protein